MFQHRRQLALALLASLAMWLGSPAAMGADPEIDKLVTGPAGKDWVTNGGGLTNQRYSTLTQINTSLHAELQSLAERPTAVPDSPAPAPAVAANVMPDQPPTAAPDARPLVSDSDELPRPTFTHTYPI